MQASQLSFDGRCWLGRMRSDESPALTSAGSKLTALAPLDKERTKDACRLALWHPSEAVLFPARLQESLAPRHHEKRENLATCPSRPSAARGNFLRPYVSAGAPPRPPTGPLGGSRDAPASGGTPEPGGAGRGWTQLWMPASPRRQPVTPADAYKKEEDNLGLPRPPGRK